MYVQRNNEIINLKLLSVITKGETFKCDTSGNKTDKVDTYNIYFNIPASQYNVWTFDSKKERDESLMSIECELNIMSFQIAFQISVTYSIDNVNKGRQIMNCPFCNSEQTIEVEDGFFECMDCDEEFHKDGDY